MKVMKPSPLPEAETAPQEAKISKLEIEGMHCAACVKRVTKALEKVEGVDAASVNFATRAAWVSHTGVLDEAALTQAVSKAGFVGTIPQKGARSLPSVAAKREADAKQRTFIISALLTLPVFCLSMFWHPRPEAVNWLLLALTTPVVFWAGWEFLAGAWSALKQKTATMDTLVALGTLSAYGVSVYGLLAHKGHHQSDHLYLESAAVIVTLILLGRTLEARARGRMTQGIEALSQLAPEKAVRKNLSGEWQEVPVQLVLPGDLVQVRPGEKVPADGVIVEGLGEVDASLMTGEPLPRSVKPGDEVQAGLLNLSSLLVMRAEGVGEETALARIIQTVEEAQGSKAPLQNLADKISSVFVPIVIVLALVSFGLAYAAGQGFEGGMIRLATVLVIACPCALGLATPTALVVGVSKGAELGMLIRSGDALERAAHVKTLILDKTGTLTRGKPELQKPLVLDSDWSEAKILALAAGLSDSSTHPLARSVASASSEKLEVTLIENHPGQGVQGDCEGETVRLGKSDWATNEPIQEPKVPGSLSLLSLAGKPLAWLNWQDELAAGSIEAVTHLHRDGLQVLLATGDRAESAAPVAEAVGIDEVHAGMTPQGKAELVLLLKQKGPVGMVGDGVNDAPALAHADVGIAMGMGADAARQAGDIVLLRSDLRLLASGLALARQTLKTIKSNLVWAFSYNVLMIPLAMAGFMNPMLASGAMAFSSVSVVLNALRLKRFKS